MTSTGPQQGAPKPNTGKIKRYFPGQAPKWANQNPDDNIFEDEETITTTRLMQPVPLAHRENEQINRLYRRNQDSADAIHRAKQRHQRYQDSDSSTEDERPSAPAKGKQGQSDSDSESDKTEDERPIENRQMVRERILRQQAGDQIEALDLLDDTLGRDGEESESDSEYDSDDEDEFGRRLIKPVFVPKAQRETVHEREALEAEEAAKEEKKKQLANERKYESQALVHKVLAREAAEADAIGRDVELAWQEAQVVTDDEDPDGDYDLWKTRELNRIKRDRAQQRELEGGVKAEIALAPTPVPKPQAPKKKQGFLQKYYHKGAFFQDAPDGDTGTAGAHEIYTRDYTAPTGEDRVDKSTLPKIMQVRNFGRSGRTKWTHLLNEDTSLLSGKDGVVRSDAVVGLAAKRRAVKGAPPPGQALDRPSNKRKVV